MFRQIIFCNQVVKLMCQNRNFKPYKKTFMVK